MSAPKHSPAPWWHDKDAHAIRFCLPPDHPDRYGPDDDGVRNVVSLLGACGGEDTTADISVMTAAPQLLAVVRAFLEPFAWISNEEAVRATNPTWKVRGISRREALLVVHGRQAVAAAEGNSAERLLTLRPLD